MKMKADAQTVQIKHAAASEIDQIVRFTWEARRDMFPMITAESQSAHAIKESATFSEKYIQDPLGAFIAAWAEGEVIATIAFVAYDQRFPQLQIPSHGTVEVMRLYVLPAWRRFGLASRLYAALEIYARRKNIRTLYLHTHPFLHGARKFWERQGFRLLQIEDDPVWQTTHMSRGLTEILE